LQQTADEVIAEVLAESAVTNPALEGVTLERLREHGFIELPLQSNVPFADGNFPTKNGKVALFSQELADQGLDPLPSWIDREDKPPEGESSRFPAEEGLSLVSGAAHHFVSSSFANHPRFLQREGEPFVEIHEKDAAERDIVQGDMVIVENERGWCELRAVVTTNVRPGVLASPKGRWSKLGNGRNINWVTSDALGDMAGQSTYHSSRVWLRKRYGSDAGVR
jgi:anaerobic selenocysteine-containing dehydrogenase